MSSFSCNLCPRGCNVDRKTDFGFCGEGRLPTVSKVMLHEWEEPCISGNGGAGTVFFSGCSLKCVYCQNSAISHGGGEPKTPTELAEIFLDLQSMGAECIDLVTPTHFADGIKEAIDIARPRLKLPIVWNTSGYETADAVRSLKGYVDVFLTDFKYCSSELSERYSAAPDYCEVATASLCEMVALTGKPKLENGMLRSGTIVRHLVLPSHYKDSIQVLRTVASAVGTDSVLLSLMAQYTPDFICDRTGFPELCRRITTFEYSKVADECQRLGFDGFFQERQSASSGYTPDFDAK